MRRSVYMQVAAEMSHAMAHLGNIPQLDPRSDNLTAPLLSFNLVAAQIQLIAESHTATLCAEMGKRLTAVFFEMISKAQSMFDLKIQIEMHESMRSFAQREFDQLIARSKALNEAPQPDYQQLTRLSQSIDLYRDQIDVHNKSILESLNKKLELQKKYSSELLSEIQPIVQAQIPLMIEIRKELELTSNAVEITARTNAGFVAFRAMINKALSRL
jgi:hypothetical protein